MGASRPRHEAFDPLNRFWGADSARQTASVMEDALVHLMDPRLRYLNGALVRIVEHVLKERTLLPEDTLGCRRRHLFKVCEVAVPFEEGHGLPVAGLVQRSDIALGQFTEPTQLDVWGNAEQSVLKIDSVLPHMKLETVVREVDLAGSF